MFLLLVSAVSLIVLVVSSLFRACNWSSHKVLLCWFMKLLHTLLYHMLFVIYCLLYVFVVSIFIYDIRKDLTYYSIWYVAENLTNNLKVESKAYNT